MAQRRRMLVIHVAAALLPCAIIGVAGYQWLRLEEDALARRGKEAAEVEAAQLRQELNRHLQTVGEQILLGYSRAFEQKTLFRLPPAIPQPAVSACLFSPRGVLLYPDYDGVFQDAVRDYRAAVLSDKEWQQAAARGESLAAHGKRAEAERVLQVTLPPEVPSSLRAAQLLILGRLALQAREFAPAESRANQMLNCCAATRDEYGLSFALYAASQLAASWEMGGRLREEWPRLAERLRELLRRGIIGHPQDLYEISKLATPLLDLMSTKALVLEAEQAADRISRQIESSRRLERWIRGVLPGWNQGRDGFTLLAIRDGESLQISAYSGYPPRCLLQASLCEIAPPGPLASSRFPAVKDPG